MENEWQDKVGQAAQAELQNIEKWLRSRPVKPPTKLQDYDCEYEKL